MAVDMADMVRNHREGFNKYVLPAFVVEPVA
jgi:hypothetical protein